MADIDTIKIRQLDFTLLLVLRALLRHRRTTAAATELRLSQSAISHALARLRRIFGDPLFERRPHGLEPTRFALALGPRVDALLRDASEALGASAEFDPAEDARDFRIAAPDHIGPLIAAPLLKTFARTAPRSRFALRLALGAEALDQVRRDEVDVALGRFQRALDGFRVDPLYVDQYALIARRNHPHIKGRVTKALFAELDHVTISLAGDFRALTDDDVRDLGLKRRIVATTPRFMTAFDAVSRTDAVAIAPMRLAARYASLFKLETHALPVALRPIRVVAVRRVHPDPAVDWLNAQLRACLADDD